MNGKLPNRANVPPSVRGGLSVQVNFILKLIIALIVHLYFRN